MVLSLDHITQLFAEAMTAVDAAAPVARNARTVAPYKPGIGPHPERRPTELVAAEFPKLDDTITTSSFHQEMTYPDNGRARCDLVLGDNGKPNDNMLMHILSPCPEHRSALTDCEKLLTAQLADRQAILIYAYDYDYWPAEPALPAFEAMAKLRVGLSQRAERGSGRLIHPVHSRAIVTTWEISP